MAQYVFGLDIGIASVGWAVLDEQRIVDLGVRCFDKAETAKEGDPLNLTRRQARLLRRRLYRRAWRLTQLARLLKRDGLIADANFFKPRNFPNPTRRIQTANTSSAPGSYAARGSTASSRRWNGRASSTTCASTGAFTGSARPRKRPPTATPKADG